MAKNEVATASSAPPATISAPRTRKKVTLSLLCLIAELDAAGCSPSDIALAADLTPARVRTLLKDQRMGIAATLPGGILGPLEAARARYRLGRAYEVLDASLNSGDRWLAHQASLAVIAADERRRERTEAVEVIVHSSFLQDAPDDGAEPLEMVGDDAYEGQIDTEDAKSMKP